LLSISHIAGGSRVRARTGINSAKRSIIKICVPKIAIGIPNNACTARPGKTAKSSAPLAAKLAITDFFIFWKIVLHSLIAYTSVAKLSSSKTISDASLATSVPIFPIATQIFAIFNAGASLIPSPVTATILLFFLSKETILILSSGDVLQKITRLCFRSSRS
jgi:hypothetical protein